MSKLFRVLERLNDFGVLEWWLVGALHIGEIKRGRFSNIPSPTTWEFSNQYNRVCDPSGGGFRKP